MEDAPADRLGIVLPFALAVELVGVAGVFALADPTLMEPEYEGFFTYSAVALLGTALAVPAFAFALARRNGAAARWAAASGTLAVAFVTAMSAAGTGPWIVCAAVTLLASYAATLVSLFGSQRPPLFPSAAGVTAAVIVLVWAVWSTGFGTDADYTGTWTARHDAASLTMTDPTGSGGGQYTLRVGMCTEEGEWRLDYPQMTTSVQVWLRREGNRCLGGPTQVQLPVVGGTEAAPVVGIPGPDGTELLLTKR
ncbi:hypothetical protein [Streptomyces sp. NPDC007369]|uniref:hypothetical protein n=1 Tax=Streptomyces sp. NPDC007369 TaxID=3154589 RepID=UPI0033EC64D7